MKTKLLIIVLAKAMISMAHPASAQQINYDSLSATKEIFPVITAFPQHTVLLYATDANGTLIKEPPITYQLPVDTTAFNFRAMKRASNFQQNFFPEKINRGIRPQNTGYDRFGILQKRIQ